MEYMDINTTFESLIARGCNTQAIFLGSGNPEDRYAFIQIPSGKWQVYYTEKGQTLEFREFSEASAACAYLVQLLENDATVWATRS